MTLRRQLLEWRFSKSDIRVKEESLTMTVGGAPVLSARVVQKQLELKWCDPTWKHWGDLQKSPELQKMVDDAEKKLKNAFELRGKGKGAGGKGHSA